MRRFFVRDILWLMLVIGLLLGWGLDRLQLFRNLNQQKDLAERWYAAAGALERVATEGEYRVVWKQAEGEVRLRHKGGSYRAATIFGYPPSVDMHAFAGASRNQTGSTLYTAPLSLEEYTRSIDESIDAEQRARLLQSYEEILKQVPIRD